MPRPNPPPTPGSSSDIRGKEADLLAPAFDLPPTAYPEQDGASSNSSAASSANGSDSSYRPASSAGPESRKRSAPHSGPVITTDDFSLPPPPTRSRKIIQMKPRGSAQHDQSAPPSQGAAKTQAAGTQGGKRKQNATGQTAAGRKIARKTAHSLIERRRRSKMNEEFGVLKDMIPACQGQEMHKLAILQASIEYLRYLEQCVSDLQAQTYSPPSLLPPSTRSTRDIQNEDDVDDNDDDDEEMLDDKSEGEEESQPTATAAPTRTNSLISLPSLSQVYPANPISPPILSSNGATSSARHFSISSAFQPSYSPYIHSNHTSPAFGPQLSHYQPSQATTNHGSSHFGLGSPALKPVDPSHSIESKFEGKKQGNSGSATTTTATASNRNLDNLQHLAERATMESEHFRHPQQPQSQFQPLPPASLSHPSPSHPPSYHPTDGPPTLINPTKTNPINQGTTPKPPTPSSSTTALPTTTAPDQDETSAAAVALSMLNSSTSSSSSVSASASAGFTSSPLFKRRRRTSEPREGDNLDRDAAPVMAGRSWRPLPRPHSSDGQEDGDDEEAGGRPQRRTSSSANHASVGPPKKFQTLDTDEPGRVSDDVAAGGGGGGGISVRDLLSS